MRYIRVLIMTAILMVMAAAPAYAIGGHRPTGNVSIEVCPERGGAYLSLPHQDFWKGGIHITKKYLEARRGENYSLLIRNGTHERIGLVVAVDGRNILSGKKSQLDPGEPMYIVNPYEYGRYEGWRTSSDKVHKFYFTESPDSYAVRTFDDSTSMGVIAVAVYREKERPKLYSEQRALDKAPAAPSAESSGKSVAGAPRDEVAGTGFGSEHYSPTIRVAFEPDGKPVEKTLIKYEWRETLCRKGVLSCGQEPGNRLWDAEEYAPYPPGYSRR